MTPSVPSSRPPTLLWVGDIDGHLELLDQRLLPGQIATLRINTIEELWHAIKTLAVRGARRISAIVKANAPSVAYVAK